MQIYSMFWLFFLVYFIYYYDWNNLELDSKFTHVGMFSKQLNMIVSCLIPVVISKAEYIGTRKLLRSFPYHVYVYATVSLNMIFCA